MLRPFWIRRARLRGQLRRRQQAFTPQISCTCEVLEDRTLLSGTGDDDLHVHPVFAPGTPQEYINSHADAPTTETDASLDAFQLNSRWSSTATDGSGLQQGDPTVLTWSIVPDGTPIPSAPGINEPAAPSNLIAYLGGIYGVTTADPNYTDEVWFPLFQSIYDRWSELSGITFVYEPMDDGAALGSGSPGVLHMRGDMRVGGHPIDGNGGTLAYNYYPQVGDMVIDTGDNYFHNTTNNSIRLRNMLAHEVGHGIGLRHLESNNAAFLMEPIIDTSFDGPQFDDILGAHRHYGDHLEGTAGGNDSAATAHDLGVVPPSGSLTIGTNGDTTNVAVTDTDFVSIDGIGDVDYYSFTLTSDTVIDVLLDPVGPTYNEGPQTNPPTPQSPFDASALSDLVLEVIDSNGTTVLVTRNATGVGGSEMVENLALGAGTYYIRVSATDDQVQMYRLAVVPPSGTDDHGNNAGAATLISVPSTTPGDIEAGGDIDYFAFNAFAGADYTFETSLITLPDSTLTLYDTDGVSQLAFDNDSGTGLASLINWTAPADGTYYLKVEGFSLSQSGTYSLDASVSGLPIGLIGIDFDDYNFSGGSTPTNWTQVNTTTNFTLVDLIDENGNITTIDASIDFGSGNGYWSFAPQPGQLPVHDQSLAGLDGNLYGSGVPVTITFQDLTPGQQYEIYVFGGDNDTNTQLVTIAGATTTQFSYTYTNNQLYVNSTLGSNAPLESFAEIMAADGSGQIAITVQVDSGSTFYGLAGLAIRPVAEDPPVEMLTLTIDPTSISENGGMATGTITRVGTSGDLIVYLSSSDTTEATVPASVTILNGQTSATFSILAVDDALLDGTQTVTITASAATPMGNPTADASFGNNGVVETGLRQDVRPLYNGEMEIQPDGKILVIGRHGTIDTAWLVSRYNPDGSPDSNFGTAGSVTTDFGISGARPETIILHPDGRITVAGNSTSVELVARYLADGTPDTTFGTGGQLTLNTPGRFGDGIVNSDGSIFLVGPNFSTSTVMIVRLTETGALDTGYGTGGIFSPDLGPGGSEAAFRIERQSDGRLIVSGVRNGNVMAFRMTSDGAVDTSFGTGGFVEAAFSGATMPSSNSAGTALAIQPDDSIVLAVTIDGGTTGHDWAVLRLTSSGSIDIDFGVAGRQELDFTGLNDVVRDVVVTTSGHIVLVGDAFVSPNGTERAVAVLDPTGALESDFGTGGRYVLPPLEEVFEGIYSTVLQPDGKLLAFAGYATNFRIERYTISSGLMAQATLDVTDDETSTGPRLFGYDSVNDEIVEINPVTGLEINRFASPITGTIDADGLAFDGSSLFYLDGTFDTLYELDPDTGAVLGSVTMASMGASLNTDALAYYNGLLVAFDFSSFHTATFIDPLSDTVIDVLSLGIANLGGVAGAASRGSFFASGVDGGAVIFEIDAVTGAVLNSFPSPVAAPHGIAFVDGALYIADISGTLREVNPDTGATIRTLPASSSWSALGGDDLTLFDQLFVTADVSAIAENGGMATGTVFRTGDTSAELVVSLVSDDASEATVPMTVTILAGQSTATFTITGVDDDLADGTQLVTITASATGYVSGFEQIEVEDDPNEPPQIEPQAFSVNEHSANGTVVGTVLASDPNIVPNLTFGFGSQNPADAPVLQLTGWDDGTVDGIANQIYTATAGDDNTIIVYDGGVPVATGLLAMVEIQSAISPPGSGNIVSAAQMQIQLTGAIGSDTTIFDAVMTATGGTGTFTATSTAVFNWEGAFTGFGDSQLFTSPAEAILQNGMGGEASFDFDFAVVASNLHPTFRIFGSTNPSDAPFTELNFGLGLVTAQMNLPTVAPYIFDGEQPVTYAITGGTGAGVFAIDQLTGQITVADNTLLDYESTTSFTLEVTVTDRGVPERSATATMTIELTDIIEALSISIDPASISENGGVATGTVTRNSGTTGELIVTLSSSDTSKATVPVSVTILDGQTSATFQITGVDDLIADGTQTVTITASADGLADGTATIDVTDDEVPALTVSIDMASISENGGMATGTVTRNTPTDGELVVTLISSDTTEASVPVSVTIPDGQTSATFAISGVDDFIVDGTQTVTLTASAAGFVDGTDTLDVTDDDTGPVTFTVDSLSDISDGDFSAGNLSLREAIELANESAGVDTIEFAPALSGGMITLGGTELLITDGVTITGLGASVLTIDAGGLSRIFHIDAATVEISGLTFSGGQATGAPQQNGGAILNDGDLTLTDMTLTGNTAGTFGGAIWNNGTLTIIGGTFSGNTANQSGGAIENNGTLSLSSATLADNHAVNSSGGAIRNLGTAAIALSSFTGNDAFFGGAITNHGVMTVTDSTIDDNTGTEGGGIYTAGSSSDLILAGVTISNNSASVHGGGIHVGSTGALTAINTTISGNVAGGLGGGLRSRNDVTLRNVTVYGNHADSAGGGAYFTSGTETLHNSLFAGNTSGASTPTADDIDVGAVNTIDTATHNFVGQANGKIADGVDGNIVWPNFSSVINPNLADNGGPTLTHALVAGGRAVDAGDNAQAIDELGSPLATDQRGAGFARILDGDGDFAQTVDIGAFEADTWPALMITIDMASISENGGTATGTVTRNTGTTGALEVTLMSSDTSEATVLATVMIPDGSDSADFTISGQDDLIADGTQTVTITASAAGFIAGTETIDVTDDEVPTLTVSIDMDAINENGGSATGTVTRNTPTDSELVVTLMSSDTSEAIVPAMVTIPIGQTSATFAITGVDDDLVDGTQTVTITATASGFTGGTATIDVLDDDAGVSVIATSINGHAPNRSGIGTIGFTFSEAMTIAAADSFNLFNHTTASSVDLSGAVLIDNGTMTVTLDLTGLTTPLADGQYTIELPSAAATNGSGTPMARTYAFAFHKLAGDVNGDRVVSFSDYLAVQANFAANVPPYGAGDTTGDGVVSFSDYLAVQANFAASLPALQLDWGDAPDSSGFPTLLASDGARHVISGNDLYLGASRDADPDGQPSADATGDDADGNNDDDGISVGNLEQGASVQVVVTANVPGTAVLNGWVDFNQDGDWDDPGEQVFADVPIVHGTNILSINVPANAATGAVIARFRLTETAGYSYFGLAPNGEVEDYQLTVTAPALTASLSSGMTAPALAPMPAQAFPAFSQQQWSRLPWGFQEEDERPLGSFGRGFGGR